MPAEPNSNEYLPIFVYGSLRPGQSNHQLFVQGVTLRELPAVLPDHAMFVLGHYPCITEDAATGDVIGHLLYLRAELYNETLAALDQLEGYRPGDTSCEYVRVQRIALIRPMEGPVEHTRAWVYVAGAPALAVRPACQHIAGGDWLAHLAGEPG